jgi:riboflavin synthase
MFTGIIRHLGKVKEITTAQKATHLTITSPISAKLIEGASVAVNGVCLTVLASTDRTSTFRLMAETLKRTNLGQLQAGDTVNLEQPITANQPIDGHFVLGHVDGQAAVTNIKTVKKDKIFTFRPPRILLPHLIPKGSVALDGVSLTVVDVLDDTFTVSMMPYTLQHTLFGQVKKDYQSNMEADILGKYTITFLRQTLSAKHIKKT